MSFPISKRLTFLDLFRICSFQGTCSLRSHADRTACGWRLTNSGSASQTPRKIFTAELFFMLLKFGNRKFPSEWRCRDSNSRPPACKAGALPTELHPHLIWQPPALPHRLQCSTIGRLGLNHRVRDGNGCVPQAHRRQKYALSSCKCRFKKEQALEARFHKSFSF